MINTDQFTRTGRRVVDMRQPKPTAFGFEASALDHSFKPTLTTATTATVSPGFIYDRFGVARVISAAAAWADGVIDFTTLRRWYVQMKYYSTGETIGQLEEILWIGTAGGFPNMRPDEYTVNFPILELPDGTWGSLKRLQTNEIIEALHYDGIPGAPDTEEPWPTPPAYDEIPGAPGIEGPWPVAGAHSALSDIAGGTAGDDHSGSNYKYLANSGNASRNAMVSGAYIGDQSGLKVFDPNFQELATVISTSTQTTLNWHLGSLYAVISGNMREVANWFSMHLKTIITAISTSVPQVVLDWSAGLLKGNVGGSITTTLDWFQRKLSGSFWTVTDTTEAGDGTGALVVDGGISAAAGIRAVKGGATYAGQFVGGAAGSPVASLGDASAAGYFFDGTSKTATLGGATYQVDAPDINASIAYYANGNKVVGAQAAAVADATGSGDVVAQLNDLLAKLRTHGLIAT